MIKHRKVLKIDLLNLFPTIICIFWVRAIYSIGVVTGYVKETYNSQVSIKTDR
jgi:hypothetical protein